MKDQSETKRILICDDDEVFCQILRAKLVKNKFEVVGIASTGLESINMFVEKKPDTVLLDIKMPMGSGLTALRFLREIDDKAYIIMLTGDDSFHAVKTAVKLGANDYLIKNEIQSEFLESPLFLKALNRQRGRKTVEAALAKDAASQSSDGSVPTEDEIKEIADTGPQSKPRRMARAQTKR